MFLVINSLWKSFSTVNKDNFKLPYIIFGESCGLIEGRTLTLEQEGREGIKQCTCQTCVACWTAAGPVCTWRSGLSQQTHCAPRLPSACKCGSTTWVNKVGITQTESLVGIWNFIFFYIIYKHFNRSTSFIFQISSPHICRYMLWSMPCTCYDLELRMDRAG